MRYRSAQDFLAGSKAFAEKISATWSKVCAFGDDHEALLRYDPFFLTGTAMRIADHYTVSNSKIQTETILWEPTSPRSEPRQPGRRTDRLSAGPCTASTTSVG